MAAEANLTRTNIKAQEIDYVNQFGKQFKSLQDLLGIHEAIPLRVGDTIKTYKSSVTLAGGKVEPGEVIPLSEVKLEPADPITLDYDKRRKAVPAEDIQRFGFERAVRKTDDVLLREIQKNIRKTLIDNLATGKGKATGEGLQKALADAWGKVQVAFEDDAVTTVAFVNPEDVATYLGGAQITTQSVFGIRYLEDFLGVNIVFMHSAIEKGKAYVTAAQNLQLAYADVDGELSKAFDFTKDDLGLIGILHDIQHERLTAETVTFAGVVVFAEVLNGVVVTTITDPVPAA